MPPSVKSTGFYTSQRSRASIWSGDAFSNTCKFILQGPYTKNKIKKVCSDQAENVFFQSLSLIKHTKLIKHATIVCRLFMLALQN